MADKRRQQRGGRWTRTAATALLLLAGGAIVNVLVAFAAESSTSQQANRTLATRVQPAHATPAETLPDDSINVFDWVEYGAPLPAVKKRLEFGESRAGFVRAVVIPGFIINTLFYALILWLIFFAPFTVRRMIRRRRGLCAKCAYPVGVSSVCTECGAAVEPRAKA